MPQLTVGELKKRLEGMDDSLDVFFRRVAPICGNIEGAYHVDKSTYGFFGQTIDCVIIEPSSDERDL